MLMYSKEAFCQHQAKCLSYEMGCASSLSEKAMKSNESTKTERCECTHTNPIIWTVKVSLSLLYTYTYGVTIPLSEHANTSIKINRTILYNCRTVEL